MHKKRMAPGLIGTSGEPAPDYEVKNLNYKLIVRWQLKNNKK